MKRHRGKSKLSSAGRAVTVFLAAILGIAALVSPRMSAAAAAAPPDTPVVGIHDSAINGCDGHETRTGSTKRNGPDYGQAITSMTSSHWAGLHVHNLRTSVPWDIAYHHDHNQRANDALQVEQLCLNYLLATAARHGVQIQIAFKPDYNDLNTYTGPKTRQRILAPSIAEYRASMNAFTATYSNCTAHGATGDTCNLPPVPARFSGFPYPPGTGSMARVRTISPWGEPNFAGTNPVGFAQLPQRFYLPSGATFDDPKCSAHPTAGNCGPVLAAQMWVAVVHRCHANCTVIAGDFSGTGGLESRGAPHSYLYTYAHHLSGLRPTVWGVHPYGDITAIENYYGHVNASKPALPNTLVGRFAAALSRLGYHSHTQIWLNEISTFYRKALGDSQQPKWTRQVQRQAADYLLTQLTRAGGATTSGQPVVTRLYYLRYADGPGFPYWALIVGGRPQPVYTVFAHRPHPK